MTFECCCCVAQRMARLLGQIVGRRQAEILRVYECKISDCAWRGSPDCLIGKEIEGRLRKEEFVIDVALT